MPFGKGLDVIQQAQSGTGKTATFCTGILQNMDYNLLECQALVLAPTRELAQQIETVMRALGDFQQVQTSLNLLPTMRAGLQGASWQLCSLWPARCCSASMPAAATPAHSLKAAHSCTAGPRLKKPSQPAPVLKPLARTRFYTSHSCRQQVHQSLLRQTSSLLTYRARAGQVSRLRGRHQRA